MVGAVRAAAAAVVTDGGETTSDGGGERATDTSAPDDRYAAGSVPMRSLPPARQRQHTAPHSATRANLLARTSGEEANTSNSHTCPPTNPPHCRHRTDHARLENRNAGGQSHHRRPDGPRRHDMAIRRARAPHETSTTAATRAHHVHPFTRAHGEGVAPDREATGRANASTLPTRRGSTAPRTRDSPPSATNRERARRRLVVERHHARTSHMDRRTRYTSTRVTPGRAPRAACI